MLDELKTTIDNVLLTIVREKSPDVAEILPNQSLVEDLGLRSLDLARIIAKLEMKLGVDPFAELVSITSIRTAGDLVAAYAKCFEEEEEEDAAAEQPAEQPRPASALEAQRQLRKQARDEG
jgi:acyl carrier protein